MFARFARRRATVMKSISWCIQGPFQSAMILMLQEIAKTLSRRSNQQRQVEGQIHVVHCRPLVGIVGCEREV